jgi:formate hydrogenlyase subunit 3/multisubunit Na+/H+ antiporter MnhD subunit
VVVDNLLGNNVDANNMERHFISVWFFIGALLAVYGVLILASGVYGLFMPLHQSVAMSQLHIGIWWGAGMLLLGTGYVIRFRPKRPKRD